MANITGTGRTIIRGPRFTSPTVLNGQRRKRHFSIGTRVIGTVLKLTPRSWDKTIERLADGYGQEYNEWRSLTARFSFSRSKWWEKLLPLFYEVGAAREYANQTYERKVLRYKRTQSFSLLREIVPETPQEPIDAFLGACEGTTKASRRLRVLFVSRLKEHFTAEAIAVAMSQYNIVLAYKVFKAIGSRDRRLAQAVGEKFREIAPGTMHLFTSGLMKEGLEILPSHALKALDKITRGH